MLGVEVVFNVAFHDLISPVQNEDGETKGLKDKRALASGKLRQSVISNFLVELLQLCIPLAKCFISSRKPYILLFYEGLLKQQPQKLLMSLTISSYIH